MKLRIIKISTIILLISLFSACESKKDTVTYDSKKENTKKETKKEQKVQEPLDKKLSQIQTIDTKIQDNDMSSKINDENSYMNMVTSNINGNDITLTSIHFGFDNYLMRDEMITITSENSQKITKVINNDSNIKVKLEGNCDEWGSDEYNFALGLKRAKTVKDSLVSNGIKSSSVVIVSLGESNPLCSSHTAKCWKKNRRVDHKLLP